jgi:hypothetical protein
MKVHYEQNVYALNTLQNKQVWELFKECHEKGGEKRMETENMISYLYQVKETLRTGLRGLTTEPIEEIITALRRGAKDKEDKIWLRKFQRAWSRLKEIIISGNVYTLLPPDLEGKGVNITAIVKAFEDIAQECFPPPENETIKLARQIGKQVKELLKELEAKMGD